MTKDQEAYQIIHIHCLQYRCIDLSDPAQGKHAMKKSKDQSMETEQIYFISILHKSVYDMNGSTQMNSKIQRVKISALIHF